MRLSEWRAAAPHRDAMSAKVLAVVDPVLRALGCEPDPHVWVAWGDDPALRYLIFAPTEPGLVACHARVNVAGEGPRASGKIIRWNRIQLGELGIETTGGHRIVSFQVEGQVLRGVDAEADAVAAFAIALFAAVDGRPLPDLGSGSAGRRGRRAASVPAKPAPKAAAKPAPKAAAKPAPKAAAKPAPKAAAPAASAVPAIPAASRPARSASAGRTTAAPPATRKPRAARG